MINSYQKQYYDITKRIMEQPHKVGSSRIGDTNSRFCEQMRIDLSKEFPIMDIKWIKFENVVHELLWMVRGETNIKYLIENDCHIWTDDAYRYYKEKYSPQRFYKKTNGLTKQIPLPFDNEITKEEFVKRTLERRRLVDEFAIKREDGMSEIPNRPWVNINYIYGNMDRIYGYQWRRFNGDTDQVQNVIDTLRTNPDDRRMIIIGHNPEDLERGIMGLPACHNYMQFYVTTNKEGKRVLNTFCNIRSNDWFLGQPYNVVQYALLTHMIATVVEMGVGELVINAVDAHLYHEHFTPANTWLERFETLPANDVVKEGITYYKNTYCRAKLTVNNEIRNIDDFDIKDFELTNYDPQPYIKAKLLT